MSKKDCPVSQNEYDEAYFRDYNRGYNSFLSNNSYHYVFQKVLSFTKIKKNQTILDVGCGRGELEFICANKGVYATGIDYSKSAIKIADDKFRKVRKGEQKFIKFLNMNAKKLEFSDNFFDAVFMLDVVEHLHPNELKIVLKETHRALKSGGYLIIHTSPNNIYMKPVKFILHLLGKQLKSERYHVNEQSRYSLVKYCDDFSIKKIWLEKDNNYWSNGTVAQPKIIKFFSKVADWILDNPISDFLIKKTYLINFLGTDIYLLALKK